MKKKYERELTKGDKSRFLACFAINASLCVVSLRLPFLNFAVGRNVVGGTKPEWSLAVFPLCSPFLSSPSAPSSLSPLTPLSPTFSSDTRCTANAEIKVHCVENTELSNIFSVEPGLT